jgi:peptidoglycan/LPS O-acetylase OafA/YrhL
VNDQKLGYIEGMRGIAAFYVVLQHTVTMVDPKMESLKPGPGDALFVRLMSVLWYGHLAVAAFIVLSGYCLQLAIYRRNPDSDGRVPNIRTFLSRRCWRILPPYYACLALSLVTCHFITSRQTGMPWAQYLPVTQDAVISHLLMVHNLSRDWMYKINGVLWSIAIEFQLYFCFAAIAHGMARTKAWLPTVLIGVAVGLTIWLVPGSVKLYPWYAVLFAGGMLAARTSVNLGSWVAQGISMIPRKDITLFSAVILGIPFLLTIRWIGYGFEMWMIDSVFGLFTCYLLIYGHIFPSNLLVKLLGAKPLVWLGTFSYSLYLVHHLVIQFAYVNRPAGVQGLRAEWFYLLAWIPMILMICLGFFWLFEKPFMKGKPQWLRLRKETT